VTEQHRGKAANQARGHPHPAIRNRYRYGFIKQYVRDPLAGRTLTVRCSSPASIPLTKFGEMGNDRTRLLFVRGWVRLSWVLAALTMLAPPFMAAPTASRRSLDGLTVLRGLAALGVFLFHLNARMYEDQYLPRYVPFVDHYYLGVDLFFILSGFILAHVHGGDFQLLSMRSARRFYMLRLARIYPVHLCVMLLFLCLFVMQQAVGERFGIGLRADISHYSLKGFLAHLALLASGAFTWNSPVTWNFPAWSVSAEWFAYLWFPLLAWTALPLSRRTCLAALTAVIVGFAVVYGFSFGDSMDLDGLIRVVFEFTAGVLIYRSAFDAPKLAVRPVCCWCWRSPRCCCRRALPISRLCSRRARWSLPRRGCDLAPGRGPRCGSARSPIRSI
jgi:peptidoglycan/LPS O-acetylase OafA/YrhL